jgi:4a-hydroxytetrahydrobiopterin dehydratase
MAAQQLLDSAAIDDALRELPDWRREDGDSPALVLRAQLPSFPVAIEVVGQVAEVAERADHHPDIDIRWRTLIFRCSTHSAGGITALDVQLAREISDLVQAAGR